MCLLRFYLLACTVFSRCFLSEQLLPHAVCHDALPCHLAQSQIGLKTIADTYETVSPKKYSLPQIVYVGYFVTVMTKAVSRESLVLGLVTSGFHGCFPVTDFVCSLLLEYLLSTNTCEPDSILRKQFNMAVFLEAVAHSHTSAITVKAPILSPPVQGKDSSSYLQALRCPILCLQHGVREGQMGNPESHQISTTYSYPLDCEKCPQSQDKQQGIFLFPNQDNIS